MPAFIVAFILIDNKIMSKITKEFKSVAEYFADFKHITNSHILAYNMCPYFYWGKRKGKDKSGLFTLFWL